MTKLKEMVAEEYTRKMRQLESSIKERKSLLGILSTTIIEKEEVVTSLEGKIKELNDEVNILQERRDNALKGMMEEINTPVNVPKSQSTNQPKEPASDNYDQIIVYDDKKLSKRRKGRLGS